MAESVGGFVAPTGWFLAPEPMPMLGPLSGTVSLPPNWMLWAMLLPPPPPLSLPAGGSQLCSEVQPPVETPAVTEAPPGFDTQVFPGAQSLFDTQSRLESQTQVNGPPSWNFQPSTSRPWRGSLCSFSWHQKAHDIPVKHSYFPQKYDAKLTDFNFPPSRKHKKKMHAPGMKKIKLDNPEEIARWRKERRKNCPMLANIERKKKLKLEKEKRGAVLTTTHMESDKEEKPQGTVIPKEVTPALCSLMRSCGSLSGSESEPEEVPIKNEADVLAEDQIPHGSPPNRPSQDVKAIFGNFSEAKYKSQKKCFKKTNPNRKKDYHNYHPLFEPRTYHPYLLEMVIPEPPEMETIRLLNEWQART